MMLAFLVSVLMKLWIELIIPLIAGLYLND